MKAVIFAAGLGTRLKPLTNSKPKALVKIGEKTLLEHAIVYLKQFGIKEFVINIHHFGDLILRHIKDNDNFGVEIQISDERRKLLDTGGGLIKMENWLSDGPFLIYNVDILTDLNLDQMVKFHQTTNSLVTLAVRNRETSRYFLFDTNYQLSGWKNIKSGEMKLIAGKSEDLRPLAFSGIHVVSPEIFKYKPPEEIFSIVDWYLELAKNHKISGFGHDNSFWLDVGKISKIAAAETYIARLK